ncbi:MAG: CPCC family cysteine-rich protein [Solirubrobacteraceae bacterium]
MAGELTYHVELSLPAAAMGLRDALDEALHRSDRHIGVITGSRDGAFYLGIVLDADGADSARDRALELVAAALDALAGSELTPQLRVGSVRGRPALAGRPRRVPGAPALAYRSAPLPGGRVIRAASEGPLGDWYAFTEEDPGRVVAGRSLREVLDELLQRPWGRPPAWLDEALAALAGHTTDDGVRYACPCCDALTLDEPPPGTHAICGVCRWEDDRVQFRDPDLRGGANRMSLREARDDYKDEG